MSRNLLATVFAVAVFALAAPSRAAESYAVDPVHSSVSFKVSHAGIAWVHGRFNEFSGAFTIDGDKSAFELTIKAASVDTNNKGRDGHLTGPDFFNVKQYPTLTFK